MFDLRCLIILKGRWIRWLEFREMHKENNGEKVNIIYRSE